MSQTSTSKKSIKTLVDDIYGLFSGEGTAFRKEDVEIFGAKLTERILIKLIEERGPPALRLSNLGVPDRKLWYTINKPEWGEPLSPDAKIKFLFGDILEELLLFLARAAGHEVTDEQREVEVNGVKGHIDGLIDGELVDAKSASSFSFKKFKSGGLAGDDPFGYISQLGAYGHALGQSKGAFLVVDKTLGKICLDEHKLPKKDWDKEVSRKRDMLASPVLPPRCYNDVAETKYKKPTGNRKLAVACAYCPFKTSCWPGLRAFVDYSGPTFYTSVFSKPNGTEISLNEVIPEA